MSLDYGFDRFLDFDSIFVVKKERERERRISLKNFLRTDSRVILV